MQDNGKGVYPELIMFDVTADVTGILLLFLPPVDESGFLLGLGL